MAKALEDAIFLREVRSNRNYAPENARAALAETIKAFYEQYSFLDFPIYRQLARMPFHFVVETNPAPFLAHAYDHENKFDARRLYYHYANPTHNNQTHLSEGDIREDSPLVYHLFGATGEPGSMAVTERDQLAFLQKENTAGISSSVAIHFTSARERQFDKTLVFLGFDFNQWHLRLIMHLIVLNELVVLFGESGTGKTSLLQAGVCPALEGRQYKPVFIRLNNTAEASELQVCRQLKEGGFLPADMP